MMQRIRQRIRKRPWMVPALLLVLVFAMGLLVEVIRPLGGSATTVGPKWVDSPTDIGYNEALGSSESTRYNGRVWADKTVYKDDVIVKLPGTEEKQTTVEIGDDDFLISYSLLAATTVVEGQSVVPLDVVFVIDLSSSMMEGGKIEQTVIALNQSVDTLLKGNSDTRIGVVTYGTNAEVLLPLDHYTRYQGGQYFSLEKAGENQSLCTSVVDSTGNLVQKSMEMSQYTNIHMGLDMGMDLLAEAKTTTDNGVTRHPALMLMSDGAPTCAGSDENNWWDPVKTGDAYGSDKNGKYTLKTIMNAAYQKQKITQHYGIEMQVYTVGVAVEGLGTITDKVMAQITLNPEKGLELEGAESVLNAWETYRASQSSEEIEPPIIDGYTFIHPKEGDITSVDYTDGYFSVTDSSGIAGAFDQVLDEIIVTGAVPTEVGEDPTHSGYITYTDPIGEYMDVKDVKALVWDSTKWDVKKVEGGSEDSNVTVYVSDGWTISPVYGREDLSEIIIKIITDPETKNQTLQVSVPAALIPLRVNTVSLNDDGTATSNVCVNDSPLRLFYTVGMRDDVLTKDKKVDLSKIDSEYIAEHITKCGDVLFYSNLYTGDVEDQAGVTKTVGNATVNFVPAANNPFYFNQSETLLYADETCDTPAKKGVSPVYVKVPYYSGTEKTYGAVKRPYDEAWMTPGTGGYLYLNDGAPCYLGGLIIDKGAGNVTKTAETYHYPIYVDPESGTTYSSETSKTTRGIQLHLGNNGALKGKIATGDLTISKTVTGNMGETERGFIFDITVYHTDGQNQANLDGTYVATRTGNKERPSTEPSTQPGTGTSVESNVTSGTEPEVSPSAEPTPSQPPIDAECPEPSLNPGEEAIRFVDGKAQVVLKHGQSITVHDLPAGYTYVVTEQDPNPDSELNIYNGEDYKVSVTQSTSAGGETATNNGEGTAEAETSVYTCTGTIQADVVETVAYTNKLYVPMVPYSFTKVDGLSFSSEDLSKAIALPGAQFVLYHYDEKKGDWAEDSKKLIDLNNLSDVWEDPITATSDAQGETRFENLQEGHYRLVETEAPEGYQLPTGQWNLTVDISGDEGSEVGTFVIQSTEDATMDTPAMAIAKEASGENTYYLMNYKPINPPVTGGDGGEDFRIGGGLLMFTGLVLACWWMWSSPRRRSEFL